MKLNILITVFCLSIINMCFSQQKADIKRLLLEVKDASYFDSTLMFNKGQEAIFKSPTNETKAEVHIYYGNYFFYNQRLEKATEYFKLSRKEAELAKSTHFENLSKIRIAYLEFEKGNCVKAEKILNDLLIISKLEKDNKNILELFNLIGIIKESKNEPKVALELYYEGLALSEANKLDYYTGAFRNNLGLIKLSSGQIKEAMIDFLEGLKFAEKEKNKRLANHLKMNICLTYIIEKKFDKAKQLFSEVILYAKGNNFPRELSNIYVNIGSTLFHMKEYSEASCYIDSAIVILKKNNLQKELSQAYLGKISLLLESNEIKEADIYLDLTNEVINKTNNKEALSGYYSLLYRKFYINKQFEKALESYINYINVRDSIENKINNKIIEELQYNYRVQQKEAELEKEKTKSTLLEISNQKEKNNKWLAVVAAIVILIILLIFFYNRYLRKIKEKQEQFSRLLILNIEEERKRISMDLHDDIGQTLSVIKSKVINSVKPTEIEEDIAKVINQTREISRSLYPSSLEKIGLIRSVASLMQDLQSVKGLECSYEIDESVLTLSINIQTNIYRIIQECVNNTIKHSGATGLKVSIIRTNDEYELLYLDNGIGIKNKRKSEGIGLLSILERAKILNGSVEIDDKNEKGFKLILKFKN